MTSFCVLFTFFFCKYKLLALLIYTLTQHLISFVSASVGKARRGTKSDRAYPRVGAGIGNTEALRGAHINGFFFFPLISMAGILTWV
jgi:hypothetical protein